MLCCKTCIRCKSKTFLRVPDAEMDAWDSGELAQDALKSLSPSERELLISGLCGTCFDKIFEKDGTPTDLAADLD